MSSTASDFGCADPRSLLVGILVLAKRPQRPPDIIALGYALRLSATNIKSHQGLAIGIDVGDEDYADAIQEKCRRSGLLVSTEGSTVLLLPSLAIDTRTAARGLDFLARSI